VSGADGQKNCWDSHLGAELLRRKVGLAGGFGSYVEQSKGKINVQAVVSLAEWDGSARTGWPARRQGELGTATLYRPGGVLC
jgi:hypothetical protein